METWYDVVWPCGKSTVSGAKMAKRYPGIKFISWREFGEIHGANEKEVLAALPEKFKEFGVDAVICGTAC